MTSTLVAFVCGSCGWTCDAPARAEVWCVIDHNTRARHRPWQKCRPVVTEYARDDLERRARIYTEGNTR